MVRHFETAEGCWLPHTTSNSFRVYWYRDPVSIPVSILANKVRLTIIGARTEPESGLVAVVAEVAFAVVR